MPTRQLRDQPPATTHPDPQAPAAPDTSRDPVLLGDVLFHTLADLARRTDPPTLPALPTQRTRPHP
ncbi:hypothetical protein BX285_0997 [Streptomyces sp. 1114.5]|uniref:hypothetical protein n=1 Tax=unclassified Streptomyces TaxID=2593676 RepID=UPI000BD3BA8B|nr:MULTISPECIES: hypothetical protein [unclassified Streptomyces]RKT16650.1 hypothetical protein BX285_0997 [Streptomyces sp. 1114.5]SOB82821.1 hypothetical protein SAMN06272789_3005 [Streptomyces sp. 1331.2]